MSETMGQIIKRLRKDRNFTQEELAEQLGVTCQAVSKWENDSGLPDISQVVPLSVVFGVPTDVLFGRYNTNDEVTIDNIIKEATAPLKTDTNNYSEADCYNVLINALKTYPTNTKLLLEALSYGCNILMDDVIENDEQRDRLYTECLHHAEVVINYCKDVSSVLRAHKWLIYLYCHFGQFEKAKEHASMFPKAIETQSMMQAWIARAMKNTDKEIDQRCHIFASLLSSIEFELRPLGDAYKRQEKYGEAIKVYQTILNIVDAVYGECEYTPPMHCLAWVHFGLAHASLLMGNDEAAIAWLEKEYEFNIKNARHFNKQTHLPIPTLAACEFKFFSDHYHIEDLKEEFKYPCFEKLKGNQRFDALLEKVEKL